MSRRGEEMNIGEELKSMRERNNLPQKAVASDLYVNQTLVSKIELGERRASREFLKSSANLYEDAQYGFAVANEVAGDYVSPLATANKGIEWHRLALEAAFKQEAIEAIEHFNNVSLLRNPEFATADEIEQIKIGVEELLDVQLAINSFLARLEQVYPVSVKECMRNRVPTWKAAGWIE